MEILFSHIPKDIKPEDLCLFVKDSLKTFGFSFGVPPIERCDVLEIYDQETREYEYHGVIKFKDPAMAEKAMKKLSGKLLDGQYVRVREFYHRTPGDRRVHNGELDDFVSVSTSKPEHRQRPTDRRRPKLVTNRFTYLPDCTDCG